MRCSESVGTRALGVKRAEVGETTPLRRTIGVASTGAVGGGRGWNSDVVAEAGVVEVVVTLSFRVADSDSETPATGVCVVEIGV